MAEPTRGDWHPADLIAALRKRQLSLKQLSREHGYAPDVLKVALRRPYPKAERIIAAALGTTPNSIWPSRYTVDGRSNRRPGRQPAYPAGANASGAIARRKESARAPLQGFTDKSANVSTVFEPLHPQLQVAQIRAQLMALKNALAPRMPEMNAALDELMAALDALSDSLPST
jgi:Ner family transcriptional regulator